jgi:hypothetical protein
MKKEKYSNLKKTVNDATENMKEHTETHLTYHSSTFTLATISPREYP